MTTLNMNEFNKTNQDGNTMTTLAKCGTSMDGHNSVTRDGLFMATEAKVGQSAMKNDTEEARKEMDRKDMKKEEVEKEDRFMNLFSEGKSYGWEELWELWDETERKEAERKEAEMKGSGRKERKKMKRKEQLERKESERKETERKETERKETERKESERMEMERKEKERKEKERKEMERREIERKESERMEVVRKEKERKETERKESERMEMVRKEKERKESERMEMVRKEKERKENERKASERMEMEGKEKERKEIERKEMERKESEKKETEGKESERMEIERKEKERKETERKEMERKESERKEIERQELLLQFQEAKGEIARLKGVIKRMCSERRLADGRWKWKEGMELERKERKESQRKESERMEIERKEMEMKVTDRKEEVKDEKMCDVSEEDDATIIMDWANLMYRKRKAMKKEMERKEAERKGMEKKELERREIERKRMEEEKVKKLGKDFGRGDILEVLRRRNIKLAAQLQETMEENALLCESMRKKEVESSAMSERKVADWRVVARRSWCRGRAEEVRFSPPSPSSPRKRELLVVGLEESAASCEIVEALCGIGSCPKEDIRMGPIRTRNDGHGTAWVQLPVAAALKAAKEGRVRVGRITARVELLKVRPLQCFKCWKYGHVQYTCHSEVDRRGKCFRCGQIGHVANTCHNAAHCALCHDVGWKATHRLGGYYCKAVVQQDG